MEHFSEEVWVDFVRGTSSSTKAMDIETHLADGCLECKKNHDLWTSVRMIAGNESVYAPPQHIVRMMKLEFVGRQKSESQNWVMANISFDSFMQPLPAGVRSGAVAPRQVVYEAEGLALDLRFDWRPHAKTICAVGQVLDKHMPHAAFGSAAIVLCTEKERLVATTETNEFGEFQLEFEPQQEHLRLSVAIAGRKTLRIPLGNLQ